MNETNPLKVAENLKKEASEFLSATGLDNVLASYGMIFYTGSFFLDTMVWPDLDIKILLKDDPYSIETFFKLGSEIAQFSEVKLMKFDNCLDSPKSQAIPPKGLYWKIKAPFETF